MSTELRHSTGPAGEQDVEVADELDDEVADEHTPPGRAGGAGDASGGRRAAWLGGLLVAALLFCAFSGWIYWTAHSDEDLAYSRARDRALVQGRAHITTLNSIEVRRIGPGLRAWRETATGPLREELRRGEKKSAQTLRERGTSARARVTDAALTELDDRAGTAALIATVQIKTTTRGGTPASDRKRFEAGLERTDEGWKLTSLTPVPVGEGS
jgi:hypothetical protein